MSVTRTGNTHIDSSSVAAASRPLRADELAEFLASGSTPTFLEDWRPKDPRQAVLSTCSSLLAVIHMDGSQVIQFAHFSVKEYLMSERLANTNSTSISRLRVSMTPAHKIVAQACLSTLLHPDSDVNENSLEKFPLAEYAAEHWVAHAHFENVSPHIQDGMRRLFEPSSHHLAFWVWIYNPTFNTAQPERPEFPSQAKANPLYYASYCCLPDIVQFFIVQRSRDVNCRGVYSQETPLGAASRMGHLEVARALVEHGVKVETRDELDYNPLDRASSEGHVEVVRVLLEHGADVNARDASM